ncbi:MAG: DUF2062 domain-containing protein [Deltaproteobacteria bacterium]|nr:DUF2062 domain-containing protein [Deltaproteobacteria bacterium]
MGHRVRQYIMRIRNLEGDPHTVALGLAIGVFIGITPTIPFHTVLAVALAFLCKGSKAAAAIGVWFANPITIPVFYYASYKVGAWLLGISVSFDFKTYSLTEIFKTGTDVAIALLLGGVMVGLLPGVMTYFIMRKIISAMQQRRIEKS